MNTSREGKCTLDVAHGNPYRTFRIFLKCNVEQKVFSGVITPPAVRPRSMAVHRLVSSFSDSLIKLLADVYHFFVALFYYSYHTWVFFSSMYTWKRRFLKAPEIKFCLFFSLSLCGEKVTQMREKKIEQIKGCALWRT